MADAADKKYMRRALQLAERGRGKTSPNPMVGAVIVKSGQIIGEGYHRKVGSAHAEVAALKKAGDRAAGATVYVTLEPCCHTAHTGPCTEALIKAGVAQVVFPSNDPDLRVKGRGARELRRAGIKVESGLLRKEAEQLNEAYFGFHRKGRPFVTLKMAQSIDGRIATSTGESRWISGPSSLRVAHQLRAENDAVLVGIGTMRADNPALTVRLVKGRNPYRVVVTTSGRLPKPCRLLDSNDDFKTVIATSSPTADKLSKKRGTGNLTFWEIKQRRNGQLDLVDLLSKAAEFGIQSILIEGGASLATSFLREGLVDKYVAVIAPIIIGGGTDAIADLGVRKLSDRISLERVTITGSGSDTVITGYPNMGI